MDQIRLTLQPGMGQTNFWFSALPTTKLPYTNAAGTIVEDFIFKIRTENREWMEKRIGKGYGEVSALDNGFSEVELALS